MKIYLIGMPGSGKSTLGSKLAKELNMQFVDLDSYIEQQAMMFIDEIFNAYDEQFFRALEKNCLADLVTLDNVVIATGGGIVKDKTNKELMNGMIFYLYVPVEILEERLSNSANVRPLLKDNDVGELYLARKDLYQTFADFIICNNNLDSATKEIKEKCRL